MVDHAFAQYKCDAASAIKLKLGAYLMKYRTMFTDNQASVSF